MRSQRHAAARHRKTTPPWLAFVLLALVLAVIVLLTYCNHVPGGHP